VSDRPVPALVVAAPEDERLVLAGPPGELSGHIRLHNPGERRVVLRDAAINDRSGALRLAAARHPLKPVVIRPDEAGSVSLSLAVDPFTPPGDYEVELEVGGHVRQALLQVEEEFDLSVEPGELVVANRAGIAQTKRLSVTNDGNVAFVIADPGVVDLRNDMPRDDETIRVAIEDLPDRDRTDLEARIVALVAAVRAKEEERLGQVDVRMQGGSVTLQPGETKVIELEIALRDELPPRRRYRGHIPVLTQDVDVVVVATGGPVLEDTTPTTPEKPPTTPEEPPKKPEKPPKPPKPPGKKAAGNAPAAEAQKTPRAPRRGGSAS